MVYTFWPVWYSWWWSIIRSLLQWCFSGASAIWNLSSRFHQCTELSISVHYALIIALTSHVTLLWHTAKPLIKDPPRKGHCMLNLSVWSPKNYHYLYFLFIENTEKRIRDKTAKFILFPKCPLLGGSTVVHNNYLESTERTGSLIISKHFYFKLNRN